LTKAIADILADAALAMSAEARPLNQRLLEDASAAD